MASSRPIYFKDLAIGDLFFHPNYYVYGNIYLKVKPTEYLNILSRYNSLEIVDTNRRISIGTRLVQQFFQDDKEVIR